MNDVIIIGGSYAGMAAALQLARARRRVLIVDAAERRNRFASHSHGFLGQDGTDPAVIWANARDQLLRYPTVEWVHGVVVDAVGAKDDFTVTLADGTVHYGRRVLLATGVRDELPSIPGLTERWGKSVFHCPYCHGYELNMGAIGIIATGPMSLHQAQMLPEWGTVTLLTNDMVDPAGLKVAIEATPIAALQGEADVRLVDGRVLHFAGLFIATRAVVTTFLGCAVEEGPLGQTIITDQAKETSVSGVFACGDAGRMPHSVSLAVGDGAWAGANLHRSLL